MEHFGDGLFSEPSGGPIFDHLFPHSQSNCSLVVAKQLHTPRGLKVRLVRQASQVRLHTIHLLSQNSFHTDTICVNRDLFEFESYLLEPVRTSIVLLLQVNSFAYLRSNEPKQKGIFFQWFVLEPIGAAVHTMCGKGLLDFRASLLDAYCVSLSPSHPSTNP